MIVGILGGGQLARMLAQAGRRLGLDFLFLSPDRDACAAPFGEHLQAEYEDESALGELANRADVVTYEFENVPAESVAFLADRVAVQPSAAAIAVARDRFAEKTRFRALGMQTANFASVDSLEDLTAAVDALGLPALLKTRTHGYDGKGQAILRQRGDVSGAWRHVGGRPCLLETLIAFDREVSIVAARGADGSFAFYPVSENVHRAGMLRLSFSRDGDPVQSRAETFARRLMDDLDYIGVLALELFQAGGALLANEIAPRVHNSGHWTIEGAVTSQFENHLRAILGWPLGDSRLARPTALVNLAGSIPPGLETRLPPECILHDYGKAARPERKVGHITVLAENGTDETFAGRTAACLRLAGEDGLAAALEGSRIPLPTPPKSSR